MLEVIRLSELSRQQRQKILYRSSARMSEVIATIQPIVEKVSQEGDSAVAEYTEKFDGIRLKPEEFFVSPDQIEQAWKDTDEDLKVALALCHSNIRNFHQDIKAHLATSWAKTYSSGSQDNRWVCGIMPTAVDRAAGYVPGGTAAYPSTAMMVSVPAFAAGVGEFIITTPPREAGAVPKAVLAAAKLAGVKRVLRIGGAQAIAALAFGTETIPQVDVIVGPGNIYVTAAKAYLSALGVVGIDFPAGPSEVVIIADETARIESVAFELLAQAEHDRDAASVLLTDSEAFAAAARERVLELVDSAERADIVRASLNDYGSILVCDRLDEAASFSNEYAPEHLQIWVADEKAVLSKIRHAGSIFVGAWSPVAIGDYASGTNHVLPTGRAARFTSGVSVSTFLKYPTVQKLSRAGLSALAPAVASVSTAEGFYSGHGRSVQQRLDEPEPDTQDTTGSLLDFLNHEQS